MLSVCLGATTTGRRSMCLRASGLLRPSPTVAATPAHIRDCILHYVTNLFTAKDTFSAKCDFKGWISGPKETETVYPTAGNLHEFHAGAETCTFIDVFIPPYNGSRVRHFYTPECFIYKPSDRASHVPSYGPLSAETHHMSTVEVGSIVKLRPIDDPRHYRINRMPYTEVTSHFVGWSPFD